MIKIGVNIGVYLALAELQKNDKGQESLILGFAEVGQEVVQKSTNILDLLNEGSDASGDSNYTKLVVFPPSLVYLGDSKEESTVEYSKGDKRPGKDIFQDFIEMKNVLAHVAKRFIPDEKNITFDVLKGVNITSNDVDTIMAAFEKEAVAAIAYKNICTQFISHVTPFIGKQDKPSRLFLVRASVNKHFGTYRKRYLQNNPFFESVNIPVNESKMYTKQTKGTTGLHEPIEFNGVNYVPNFTTYELTKGFDSGAAISSDEEEVADNSTTADLVVGLSAPSLFVAGGDATASPDAETTGLAGLSI